ncbi:LysR family transcriptional regulator [Buttiauxella sp. B2]|uniref:LysR family transcriptional regulator n=1 Tax=Buttiauxella sp. B2 TaxID=2587812 RepID=UPI00111FED76|nr:LysR family transcriptional regulator [Buttiauxella sp. B2]TNV20563.1 LysR family transcriptional regulator [Buttiauxella sp. B2]
MTINQLDIKVLRAIHVLITCGSVTRTAEILKVTPAAISYLINKARKVTGSPLFIRTRSRMEADTVAQELSQRYQNIINEFNMNDSESSLDERTLSIMTYSLLELLLSMDLLNSPELPAKVNFVRQEAKEEERLISLRNKEVDIDIGTRLPSDRSINQLKLFSCDIGIMVRKDHPTIRDTITIDEWNEARHVIWGRGMHFFTNEAEQSMAFGKMFREQKCSLISYSSLSIITLCAYNDILAFMPKMIGHKIESIFPVKCITPPSELRMSYECYLHYHHSHARNPKFQNLVSFIQKSFSEDN